MNSRRPTTGFSILPLLSCKNSDCVATSRSSLGTSSVDALWARFYRRALAPHGKFPGVPRRAQVATQFRDNACFTKGKCCINCERPVNKGLAMLQMLVAQSGHEKDPHDASALPFLQQAQLAFPPRP